MGLALETPPTSEPVTLTEAKAHLRVSTSSEDTPIGLMITAAREYVELYTGVSLMTRTWALTLGAFADPIELPRGPVASIDAVEYVDANGDPQTIDAADYELDVASTPAQLVRADGFSWPELGATANAVTVTYTAGMDTFPTEFTDLKLAILLMIGHFYLNREAAGSANLAEVPLGVDSLCRPYRLPTLK